MIINCVVVDDEPVARKLLEEYIADTDFLRLAGKSENTLKAKILLEENSVDLLFLDINMPLMNGIDFLRETPQLPSTVLTTAYVEYVIKGFDLQVLDYLVKPFSYDRFLRASVKAREYCRLKNGQITNLSCSEYFFVKCDSRIEKVFYDELIYAEAMLNYVILHSEERKLIVYLTIKSLMEQLPAARFLKVHKSTVINKDKIRSIQGNQINFIKSSVSISQALQESVMPAILEGNLIPKTAINLRNRDF